MGRELPAYAIEDAADGVVEAIEAILAEKRASLLELCDGDVWATDTTLSAAIGRAFVRASIRMMRSECQKDPPYDVIAEMMRKAGNGPLLAELRREYARGLEVS